MFGSQILDVAIGIVMLFLLLSLVCSSIKEAIETVTRYRAKDLEKGIQQIFNDPATVASFYNHPLIYALFPGDYKPGDHLNLPSYIPAKTFATAVLDLYSEQPDNSSLKRILSPLIRAAGEDVTKTQHNLEHFFDGSMDRVSGWYKRRTQLIIALVTAGIVIGFNVDCIAIARYLDVNPSARNVLIDQASKNIAGGSANIDQLRTAVDLTEIPIGWRANRNQVDATIEWRSLPSDFGGWALKVAGLLGTIFAVALGAPFWFDVLNKFMVIRSTVKPDEKSPPEPSKS